MTDASVSNVGRRKLVFLVNVDWFFISHRLPLAVAAAKQGFEVLVLTCDTGRLSEIHQAGLRAEHVPLARAIGHPLRELRALLQIWRLLGRERPDILHCVAFKAVMTGGLLARLRRVPAVVLAVTGMGSTFIGDTPARRVWRMGVRMLLRWISQGRNVRMIIQNKEDAEGFVRAGIVSSERVHLVRGSGVDLGMHACKAEPDVSRGVRFVMPSRLLRDKGVLEYVRAARQVLEDPGRRSEFWLCGDPDPHNPSSFTREEAEAWQSEGVIRWLGHVADMRPVYEVCHVVVLPSYREGLPKTLVEAGASGRSCIATDVVGCREIIQDGVNGLLVPARDAEALASAMRRLRDDDGLRARLASRAREEVELHYGLDRVISQTLDVYQRLLAGR